MDIGWPEILIVAVVIFALFGYKKLPDATRSIGRSLRIFKAETKGMRDDDKKPEALEPPRVENPATGAEPRVTEPQAGPDQR